MNSKLIFIFTAIIEITVYGFIYYMGYRRGLEESRIINQKIEIDVRKLALDR